MDGLIRHIRYRTKHDLKKESITVEDLYFLATLHVKTIIKVLDLLYTLTISPITFSSSVFPDIEVYDRKEQIILSTFVILRHTNTSRRMSIGIKTKDSWTTFISVYCFRCYMENFFSVLSEVEWHLKNHLCVKYEQSP